MWNDRRFSIASIFLAAIKCNRYMYIYHKYVVVFSNRYIKDKRPGVLYSIFIAATTLGKVCSVPRWIQRWPIKFLTSVRLASGAAIWIPPIKKRTINHQALFISFFYATSIDNSYQSYDQIQFRYNWKK